MSGTRGSAPAPNARQWQCSPSEPPGPFTCAAQAVAAQAWRALLQAGIALQCLQSGVLLRSAYRLECCFVVLHSACGAVCWCGLQLVALPCEGYVRSS